MTGGGWGSDFWTGERRFWSGGGGVLGLFYLILILGAGAAGVRGGTPESVVAGSLTLLFPAIAILTALLLSGGFATEWARGVGLLWIQKPVSPSSYYAGRLVEGIFLASGGALLLAGGMGAALHLTLGVGGEFLLRGVPPLLPLVLMVGVATWAVSGAGIRGEGGWALLLLLSWTLAGVTLPAGGEGWGSLIVRWFRKGAPPLPLLQELSQVGVGGGALSPHSLVGFLIWVGGVFGMGVLLLELRIRRVLPDEQSR